MRSRILIVLATALATALTTALTAGGPVLPASAAPAVVESSPSGSPRAAVFDGTIYIDPDIIPASSPSVFKDATYQGRDRRQVFDRRKNKFITIRAFVVRVRFKDGTRLDAVVNPEFRRKRAAVGLAHAYGRVTGQLPASLRRDVKELWIHKGTELFGGGNHSLLIHTGQAKVYKKAGILEEALAHEATHTSLDARFASSPGWQAAQAADGASISTYGQANLQREDLAESVVPWLAVRFARDRVDPNVLVAIEQAIPNRLAFLDQQGLDLRPFVK
ncbi:hypothetical protein G5V58_15525 [Nocardioides anomalus]|uniref:M1 family metallopeptidase n=1 Tax=Nocardioides anomalus TaxID=2712223 RepID=A0A6G6WFX6_9ACTN|nr:hypothetical protein [Nocardioides anomalus]QIG43995.1 hypothetical protein G5V58_15525 [Nocardioides anomalus]